MRKAEDFNCGFIGLGSQGAPIARRMMQSGIPMTLWARREETLIPFRESAASIAGSIEDLASRCNYVAVCVTGDAGVTEVCEALIEHLRKGSFLVVHSTVLPATVQGLDGLTSSRKISLIDAPVSGGGPAAERGELTIMTGGDEKSIAQIEPVLESFGGQSFHLGGVGAAQAAKLINNSLMAATMGLSRCAVDLGTATGLDRAALLELLAGSSGRSFALDVLARHDESQGMSFTSTLQEKVKLLGEVLGTEHPTYLAFSNAAAQLGEAYRS